jgi:hypothetical protein
MPRSVVAAARESKGSESEVGESKPHCHKDYLNLDAHHVTLYAGLSLVALVGGIAYHERTIDYSIVKAKADAQEQVIDAANKRIAEREADFKAQIASLLAMKSTPATTPAQIVERIPQLFPALQPILQQPVDQKSPPAVVFDAPQAKILNDTLVDCKICKTDLAKASGDLTDTKTTLAAMTKERDEYKIAAKGGSVWKRAKRIIAPAICAGVGAAAGSNSKGSAIGAVTGALGCALLVH